jgi:hypothetical protein
VCSKHILFIYLPIFLITFGFKNKQAKKDLLNSATEAKSDVLTRMAQETHAMFVIRYAICDDSLNQSPLEQFLVFHFNIKQWTLYFSCLYFSSLFCFVACD